MKERPEERSPLLALSDAHLELVLAAGSLKDQAAACGVSYPTIRARLERVIARLQAVMEGRPTDPMSHLLADLVERGEVTLAAARAIRDPHRLERSRREE